MKFQWVKNIYGAAAPLRMLVPMLAGSSHQIEPGDPLVLDTGNFIPLAADQAMSGVFVIADDRVTAGDLAGYRYVIVPRAGDLFKATLATASAAARGQNVFVTDATAALATTGSNQLGDVFDHGGFPSAQGKADVGDVADRGTTVRSTSKVLITIKASVSYLAALQA